MKKWSLKDKNGLFRSRKAFKLDCIKDSDELWEKRRRKRNIK